MHKIIQRLQSNQLTSWLWITYQHEDCGYMIMLPFWQRPSKRYFKVNRSNDK